MSEGMQIVGGVRYRDEDLARLGITKAPTRKSARVKAKEKDDGGSVSGAGSRSGDADGTVSDKPEPLTSARQGK